MPFRFYVVPGVLAIIARPSSMLREEVKIAPSREYQAAFVDEHANIKFSSVKDQASPEVQESDKGIVHESLRDIEKHENARDAPDATTALVATPQLSGAHIQMAVQQSMKTKMTSPVIKRMNAAKYGAVHVIPEDLPFACLCNSKGECVSSPGAKPTKADLYQKCWRNRGNLPDPKPGCELSASENAELHRITSSFSKNLAELQNATDAFFDKLKRPDSCNDNEGYDAAPYYRGLLLCLFMPVATFLLTYLVIRVGKVE